MRSRRWMVAAFAACALAAPGGPTARAEDFPNRPITFVVPFPPGGGIDVVLRAMAPKLQERLGKPVLVENRAGGGGNIAAAAVAKSPPTVTCCLPPPARSRPIPSSTRHCRSTR